MTVVHSRTRCLDCGYTPLDHESVGNCPTCFGEHWEIFCNVHSKCFTGECPWCGYSFIGKTYRTPSSLCSAILANPEVAMETIVGSREFDSWISGFGSFDVVTIIDLNHDPTLARDERLSLIIAGLGTESTRIHLGRKTVDSASIDTENRLLDGNYVKYAESMGILWLVDHARKWQAFKNDSSIWLGTLSVPPEILFKKAFGKSGATLDEQMLLLAIEAKRRTHAWRNTIELAEKQKIKIRKAHVLPRRRVREILGRAKEVVRKEGPIDKSIVPSTKIIPEIPRRATFERAVASEETKPRLVGKVWVILKGVVMTSRKYLLKLGRRLFK